MVSVLKEFGTRTREMGPKQKKQERDFGQSSSLGLVPTCGLRPLPVTRKKEKEEKGIQTLLDPYFCS